MSPDAAPVGTVAVMLVLLQVEGLAAEPLNVNVPVEEPKFVPVIVTLVPTLPSVGETMVMYGADDPAPPAPVLPSVAARSAVLSLPPQGNRDAPGESAPRCGAPCAAAYAEPVDRPAKSRR